MQPDPAPLHHRLVEKIGEGGMGVVYRAIDTRLDREVAVKVLPGILARDAERLARFEREAGPLGTIDRPDPGVAPGGRILPISNPGVDSRRSQVRLILDLFQDQERHD